MIQKSVFRRLTIIILLGLAIFAVGCDRYLDIITKPPEPTTQTGRFAVVGEVYQADSKTLVSESLTVTVKNLTTGSQRTTTTGGDAGKGRYSVSFVDTEKNRAAAVGDEIELTVMQGTKSVSNPIKHEVTIDDIRQGRAIINVVTTITEKEIKTAIFAVGGSIYLMDGVTLTEESLKVTVKNLVTGTERMTTTGGAAGSGRYSVAFVDTDKDRAAAVGDTIQVTVAKDNSPVGKPVTYTVTVDDINSGRAVINFVTELPTEKITAGVFAIGGVVYQADGHTPVTQPLTVRITNLTAGLAQTTKTGGLAGAGRYAVAFVDTSNNRAAASGDQIEVTVTDDSGQLAAEPIKHTISVDEIRSGRAIINVTTEIK